MSDNVKFYDYHVDVKNAIKEKAIAFLYEIGGEVRARAVRNSDERTKSGKTKGSYQFIVDEEQLAVHIGSDYINAIWEEFGTGVHAINGDGRKGWWVYVDDGKPLSEKSNSESKSYNSAKEARRAVAILRKKGLNAYYTQGKTANRPLKRAFEWIEGKVEKTAKSYFGGL